MRLMQLRLASFFISVNAVLLRSDPGPAANRSFARLDAGALVHDEQVSAAAAACNSGDTCRMLKTMRVCGTCAGGAAQMERLGARHDGGYVQCSDSASRATSALSLGINGVDDWGIAVSEKYRIPIHEYDCTNPRRPQCPFGAQSCELHFFHECVDDGSHRFSPAKTLAQMLQRTDTALPEGDTLMKMDVENAEWGSLRAASISTLRRFNQIVVEFHGLRKTDRHAEYADIMEKLLQEFVVVHTHGNTCCGFYNYMGYAVPTVFEVTFARKDVAKATTCLAGRAQPQLDEPNHPGRAEVRVVLPA